jgi:short-subunit dehydrogenase
MISSEGGQRGMPFVGPYSASKFALEGYSQSLRRELMLYDIDVIVVGPGAIATPIWDKALKNDLSRFGQTNYGPSAQKVSDYMVQQGRDGLPANATLWWTAPWQTCCRQGSSITSSRKGWAFRNDSCRA